MSARWHNLRHPKPQPMGLTAWLPIAVLIAVAMGTVALIFVGFFSTRAHAECSSAAMMALAQEHSNDMARRDHLDHDGFGVNGHQHCVGGRCARGAMAENVGIHRDEAGAISGWRRSPPHAANMRLHGCRAIASAVSRSGRKYWTMEIGQ